MLTLLPNDVHDCVLAPALGVVALCRAGQACHSLHDRTTTRRDTLRLVYRFLAQSIARSHRVHCSNVLQTRTVQPPSCFAFGYTRHVAVTGAWRCNACRFYESVRRPDVEFLRLDGGSILFPGVQPMRLLALLCPSLFPLADGIFLESFHLSFEEYVHGCHHPNDELRYRQIEHVVVTAPTTVGTFTLRGDLVTSNLPGLRGNTTPAAFLEGVTHINWEWASFAVA